MMKYELNYAKKMNVVLIQSVFSDDSGCEMFVL
jgi:hypothetical protein